MNGLATWLGIGPFAEFLGKPAVVGMRALAIGQTFVRHQPLHPLVFLTDIVRSGSKQVSNARPSAGVSGCSGNARIQRRC